MAEDREPPPLFGEDEDVEDTEQDDGDLFTSMDNQPLTQKSEEKKELDQAADNADKEDIFADAQTEVPLTDSDEESINKKQVSKDEPPEMGVTETKTTSTTQPAGASSITAPVRPARPSVMPGANKKSREEIEEEDSGDEYNIEISVTDPKKVGDGMNAYMAYKVATKSSHPQFSRSDMSVYRRFSDFLGLHSKLVEAHQHKGVLVPPAPEKSVLGMTKIKMSKEEAGSVDFVEKRRAALERYLNRTAKHPQLRGDTSFIEFLEKDGDLPKATSTQALSGAGMMRLFSKVGDSLNKMTFKMDETDQWFEDKQQQIEALDHQLKKLHSSIEALVQYRKDLAINTGSFAKSAAMLGNAEENTALSRALSQLSEIEEKIDQLHLDQADSDFFVFSELIKDYICLIASVKDVFHERVKIFKAWKDAEVTLGKKRETKAKFELARKMDKVLQAEKEISEWELKVDRGQEDFEKMSKSIRTEITRFEKQRVRDFKSTIINYLESLMNSQQQLIKYWESFLPEAKAIA